MILHICNVITLVAVQLLIWGKLSRLSYKIDDYYRKDQHRNYEYKKEKATVVSTSSKPRGLSTFNVSSKRKQRVPFKRLSPAQRELILLKTDAGMKPIDIAKAVNLTPQQIYAFLYQERQKAKTKDKQ